MKIFQYFINIILASRHNSVLERRYFFTRFRQKTTTHCLKLINFVNKMFTNIIHLIKIDLNKYIFGYKTIIINQCKLFNNFLLTFTTKIKENKFSLFYKYRNHLYQLCFNMVILIFNVFCLSPLNVMLNYIYMNFDSINSD